VVTDKRWCGREGTRHQTRPRVQGAVRLVARTSGIDTRRHRVQRAMLRRAPARDRGRRRCHADYQLDRRSQCRWVKTASYGGACSPVYRRDRDWSGVTSRNTSQGRNPENDGPQTRSPADAGAAIVSTSVSRPATRTRLQDLFADVSAPLPGFLRRRSPLGRTCGTQPHHARPGRPGGSEAQGHGLRPGLRGDPLRSTVVSRARCYAVGITPWPSRGWIGASTTRDEYAD